MLRANQLDIDRACVLTIDLQTKLLPFVWRHERVVAAAQTLLNTVRIFGLPVLATEQYPRGIGPTVAPILKCLQACNATIIEKPTFSCCGEKAVLDALLNIDRPQVIVLGIEAHVCVQQTCLDLIFMDYDVFVCADAISSRGGLDYRIALDRMRQDGVYVTTVESVLFELCERCDTPRFKEMLDVIKNATPSDE